MEELPPAAVHMVADLIPIVTLWIHEFPLFCKAQFRAKQGNMGDARDSAKA